MTTHEQTELWHALYDAVDSHCTGSAAEVYEIADAATAVARSRIELAEKERDLMLAELQKVRIRLANELRQRAYAVQDGPDVMRRRLLDALKDGAGARDLAAEAYRVAADVIENGGRS